MDEFKIVDFIERKTREQQFPHLYTRTVRRLLFTAGLLMVVGLPFFAKLVAMPPFIGVLATVAIVTLAGLTNPDMKQIMYLDAISSFFGFLFFEYIAVRHYLSISGVDLLFLFNQTLAVVFFLALFFCIKTIRTFVLQKVVK